MTKLTQGRSLRRETGAVLRGRTLFIELGRNMLTIRPKGARWRYEVDYDSIFVLGAKKEAERQRRERKSKKDATKTI